MAKSKDHIDKKFISKEEMLRYLADDLNDKERHQIERKMLEDDFTSEAMEGLSALDKETTKSDLHALEAKIKGIKLARKIPVLYWRIAAAVTFLLVFSFAIYFVLDSNREWRLAQEKSVVPQKQDSSAATSPELSDKSNLSQPEKDTMGNNKGSEPEDHMLAMENKGENKQVEREKKSIIPESDLNQERVEEVPDEVMKKNSSSYAESIAPEKSAEKPEMTPPATGNIPQSSRAVAGTPNYPSVQTEDFSPSKKMDMAKSKAAVAAQPSARAKSMEMKTVTGKVMSSEDQEPIPGANIILKGTATGVVSDINGDFVMEVPKETPDTLVISSVGYNAEKVPVKDKEKFDVTLNADTNALSEIVVTGYGVSSAEEENGYHFTPPLPAGGKGSFNDYVDKHIKYPSSEIGRGIKGTVKLKFTVNTNGHISNIQVTKSLGESFDREAIRLLQEGPSWEPARENGISVVRDVTLKISFRPPTQ